PLLNFFIPTFKLKEKIRIGARIVKKYDKPLTPYERLMKSPHLAEERKERLRERKATLNPFKLKADLETKLEVFFKELKKTKIRQAS
ncbi:integrase, partial [Bdellovibrionota bacterium FG-1]